MVCGYDLDVDYRDYSSVRKEIVAELQAAGLPLAWQEPNGMNYKGVEKEIVAALQLAGRPLTWGELADALESDARLDTGILSCLQLMVREGVLEVGKDALGKTYYDLNILHRLAGL